MKKYFYSILGIIILSASSCDFTPETNYQPDIFFLQKPISNNDDTLSIYNTFEANTLSLDTLHVGDTVSFFMYLEGYTNNLTEFYLKLSADSAAGILLPNKASLDSIFLSTSNYNQGKFLFDLSSTELYFPFKYIAKKASLDAKLTFTVISDANFEYNQNYIILETPILTTTE